MSSARRAEHRPRRHRVAALIVVCCAALTNVVSADEAVNSPAAHEEAPAASTDGASLDFLRDVYPIFQLHCLECHGPDEQAGDLRLDRREFAARGGHTGRPILSGDAATNALLQRVTTDDVGLRMPKSGEPLSTHEIEVLSRWVQAGTPWVDPPETPAAAPHRATTYAFTWPHWSDLNPQDWDNAVFERISWWFYRFGIAWTVVLLFIGLCERSRLWVQLNKPWTIPPRGRLWRRLARVSRAQYLAIVLAMLLVACPVFYQQQTTRADVEIGQLREQIEGLQRELHPERVVSPEGPPLVRPQHPPRLGGEYYRGNDERNPALYNGGFYRTCVISVWLCREDGEILHWGDVLPEQGVHIRFEIEQSPGASDHLFGDDIWKSTFLSAVPRGSRLTDPKTQVKRFQKRRRGFWTADYPINLSGADASPRTGEIYLYRGPVEAGAALAADPHYAAEYSLRIEDGRITSDSELWLGCLFRTGNVVRVPPGKIADDEWFSFRPIPEIQGEQTTTDPKLLGIEEHRRELESTAADGQSDLSDRPIPARVEP